MSRIYPRQDVSQTEEQSGRFAAELYREGGPDPERDPDLEEPTIEQSMPRRALMD